MKTINLKGKQYAPVSERIKAFHEAVNQDSDYQMPSILTEVHFADGWVWFKATISYARGEYTGHALGKVDAEKAFEKLETVAVGRALANAGFAVDGEIASLDEMERFQANTEPDTSSNDLDF